MADGVDVLVARLAQRVEDIDARGTSGLGRVEQRLVRNEQRVADMDDRLTTVLPSVASVSVLTERIEMLRREVAANGQSLTKLDDEIDRRREEDMREDRRNRLAMWTLIVMVLCALIGAITLIATSGVPH